MSGMTYAELLYLYLINASTDRISPEEDGEMATEIKEVLIDGVPPYETTVSPGS